MMNSVGKIIRKKRKELKLTQAKLAERIGCNEYYISKIETGARNPGRKYLIAFSNGLNIPIDSLLGSESNIALHEELSALELKMQDLNEKDKDMLLDGLERIVDRLLE